jgi:hypothetical protein
MNRALLVGINKYPAPNELNGCVNDVTDMAGFLVSQCSYAHDDIRLIIDERATAKNIVDRLHWLLGGVRKGDRIFFHYSGHGAQVAARNPQGQTDRYDEVICPVDFSFDDDSTMIRDKDFVRLFQSVPAGVEFVWVSDSCFSGGLTKAMLAMPANVTAFKRKTFALPADIQWRNRSAEAANLKPLGMKGAAGQLNVALISGCTATQESADADIGGRYNGALTYYLLSVLKGSQGLTAPLAQVVKTVVQDLAKARFDQQPELLGSKAIGQKPFLAA